MMIALALFTAHLSKAKTDSDMIALELIVSIFVVIWALINVYNIYPLLKSFAARMGESSRKDTKYFYLPDKLPRISIMIPAYREEGVLRRCVDRIFDSKYPQDLIDLIILTEKDDKATIKVAQECIRKYGARHVMIRETDEPKGKPRALRQGYIHADNEIIGIVDAEDIVDLWLLKKVAAMIDQGYDVVQGTLALTNDYDGWKNLHSRAEYGYWYKRYLPSLAVSGLLVPLGGTTCFFKRSALEDVGLWDAFNLTEDFDMGLRLYNAKKKVGIIDGMETRKGYDEIFANRYNIGTLDSVTREESPTTFMGWLRQRTRWQRGKIQTLKKFIRKPPASRKDALHTYFISFIPHLGAINTMGIILSIYALFIGVQLPSAISYIAYFDIFCLFYYCYAQAMGFIYSTDGRNKHRVLKAFAIGLTTPLYWAMQWVADFRAMKHEYIDRSIFWEKTEHLGRHYKVRTQA